MARWFINIIIYVCLAMVTTTQAVTLPLNVDVVREGTKHRALYGIAMDGEGIHGIAVGDRGTLLETADGGRSWTEHQLDTSLALFDAVIHDDRWLIVGQMGLVGYSDDRGQSWSSPDIDTRERLLGVAANSDGLAVAVGSFGTIRVSEDGGANWRTPDFNVSEVVEGAYDAHLYDVHVADDGTVLIAGEFGLILRSRDGGETWDAVHQDSVSLFGLYVEADGDGYAVGQEGAVLRTEDAGKNWSVVETGMGADANLLGVVSSPDGTIVVPGMRRMIVSDDHGATWTNVTVADVNRNWYGTIVQTSKGIYAVGHTARVIHIQKQH